MTRAAFLLLFIVGISSCKKYFDPKYTYTQPVLDFKASGNTIEADSAMAFIDSLRLDTTKVFTYFTNIRSFKESETLINIRLQGKSIGNFYATVTDSTGSAVQIESGRFNAVQY